MPLTEEQKIRNKKDIEKDIAFIQQYLAGFNSYTPKIEDIAGDARKMKRFQTEADFYKKAIKDQKIKMSSPNDAVQNNAKSANIKPRPTQFDILKKEVQQQLKELNSTLSRFSKDSDEFKLYRESLENLSKAFDKPYDKIQPEDAINITKLANRVSEAAYTYSEARQEKNKTQSSRRANKRLKITENLQKVLGRINAPGALEQACKDLVDERSRIYSLTTKLEKKAMADKISKDLEKDDPYQGLTAEEKAKKYEESWKDIEKAAQAEEAATDRKINVEAKELAEQNGQLGKGDDLRFQRKAMLEVFVKDYSKVAAKDKELSNILKEIQKYAKMDATAVDLDIIHTEEAKYEEIYNKLDQYCDKLQEKMATGKGFGEREDNYLRVATNMLAYFESQRNGNLEIDEKSHHVVATGMTITNTRGGSVKRLNSPLFPHDPSPNDILQGGIGDCYLVSSLSAIAMQNPKAIKDAMVDNGDGTVTVRFFQRSTEKGFEPGTKDKFEPVYVTVDKIVPAEGGSINCLWTQMFERAYAASGLYFSGGASAAKSDFYGRPVPDNIDLLYEQLKNTKQKDWPSHDECPWLIGVDGKLHRWQPQYAQIEGGQSSVFIEAVLGAEYQSKSYDIQKSTSKVSIFNDALKDMINEADFLTDDQKQDFIQKIDDGIVGRREALYKIISEGGPYELDRNGEISFETDVELENYYLAKDLGSSLPAALDEWIADPKANGTRTLADANEFFKHLVEDPNFMPNNKDVQYYKKQIDNEILVEKTLEKFFNKISESAKRNLVSAKIDGKYTDKQLETVKKIKESLAKGEIVTASTRSATSDKVNVDGINLNHAYTVLGVESKIVKGKEYHFVRVRNPHGIQNVRQYDIDEATGKITPRVDSKVKGAESLVELNEFYRDFASMSVNGKQPEPKPVSAKDPLNMKTIGSYNAILKELQKSIKALPNQSKITTGVISNLDLTINKIGTCYGKDMSTVKNAVNESRDFFSLYYGIAKKDPQYESLRPILDAVNETYGYIHDGYADPRRAAMSQLATKVTDGILDIAKKGGNPFDKIAKLASEDRKVMNELRNRVTEIPSFKKMYGDDFTKVISDTLKEDNQLNLGKEFCRELLTPIAKEYKKEVDKIILERQAPTNQAPTNQVQKQQKVM